jgi:hypothetical protein
MSIDNVVIHRVSSNDRLYNSKSPTDFNYKLELPSGNRIKVLCTRAVIPKTYYNVDSSGNTFTLIEDGVETLITVSPGNYEFYTFDEIVTALLNVATTNGSTYNILSNDIYGTMQFTSSSIASIRMSSNVGVNELLGLTLNTTYTTPFESSTICVFNEHDSLTIHSTIVSGLEQSILCNLPIAHVSHYDYITYQYIDRIIDSRHVVANKPNIYNFRLSDARNNTIDLNGLSWSFDLHIYEDLDDKKNKLFERLDMLIDFLTAKADTEIDSSK